ncbi:MAG: protein tyrosine phosphatase family protein [Gemmatimonadota bacterium]
MRLIRSSASAAVMAASRATVAAVALAGCVACTTLSSAGRLAPNYVEVSPRLATAGVPTREQIRAIAQAGYQVVISLVPPDSMGALRDEAALVASQRMRYHNIPVNFARPAAADYARFVEAMTQHQTERVLVHCEINLRASSFVFLYRVLELGEDPDRAYDAVLRVWRPSGQWHAFIAQMLGERGAQRPLAFDL